MLFCNILWLIQINEYVYMCKCRCMYMFTYVPQILFNKIWHEISEEMLLAMQWYIPSLILMLLKTRDRPLG